MSSNCNLPKLLYVGDVPVEKTVAGPIFFYRLLSDYPSDKLQIVESNLKPSCEGYRLQNIIYHQINTGNSRLLNSRFSSLYSTFRIYKSQFKKKNIPLETVIDSFKPDVILTVAHGVSWLFAAHLAKDRGIPLHLVLHDDWIMSRASNILPQAKPWARRLFASVYKQAAYRWCISPEMEEYYYQNYKVHGNVLFPIRSKELSILREPCNISTDNSLRFAYAGSLHVPDYQAALTQLAEILVPLNCHVKVFTSLPDQHLQKMGLIHPGIQIHPFINPESFIDTIRQNADVLFSPVSFRVRDKDNDFETFLSFPSKLADYTSVGLPILIWGDPNSPAVRWAKRYPGVAYTVESKAIEKLKIEVKNLIQDFSLRQKLARKAIKIGHYTFSHERGVKPFYDSLQIELSMKI